MNPYLQSLISVSILSCCLASNTSSIYHYQDEVRSLSELPLEKLIKIKSSFARRNLDNNYNLAPEARVTSALALPMAMPLKRMSSSNNKPMRRYEEWEEKGKGDSKISKIFQLTVTALSFLAFGGYLLTLIITAIKRNQNAANPGVIVLSGLNSIQKPSVKRPKRGLLVFDPAENEYDTEMMYRGMIMLSSDYSRHYY